MVPLPLTSVGSTAYHQCGLHCIISTLWAPLHLTIVGSTASHQCGLHCIIPLCAPLHHTIVGFTVSHQCELHCISPLWLPCISYFFFMVDVLLSRVSDLHSVLLTFLRNCNIPVWVSFYFCSVNSWRPFIVRGEGRDNRFSWQFQILNYLLEMETFYRLQIDIPELSGFN